MKSYATSPAEIEKLLAIAPNFGVEISGSGNERTRLYLPCSALIGSVEIVTAFPSKCLSKNSFTRS